MLGGWHRRAFFGPTYGNDDEITVCLDLDGGSPGYKCTYVEVKPHSTSLPRVLRRDPVIIRFHSVAVTLRMRRVRCISPYDSGNGRKHRDGPGYSRFDKEGRNTGIIGCYGTCGGGRGPSLSCPILLLSLRKLCCLRVDTDCEPPCGDCYEVDLTRWAISALVDLETSSGVTPIPCFWPTGVCFSL